MGHTGADRCQRILACPDYHVASQQQIRCSSTDPQAVQLACLGGEADVAEHTAAFLRHAHHVERRHMQTVEMGGHAHEGADGDEAGAAGGGASAEKDEMYDQAVEIVLKNRKASISLVQRHLKIGYTRAARMLEEMENAGLVSAMSGSGQRDILVPARAE